MVFQKDEYPIGKEPSQSVFALSVYLTTEPHFGGREIQHVTSLRLEELEPLGLVGLSYTQ